MSRYYGKAGRGARTQLREQKRLEAEARNARTPHERRRATRLAALDAPQPTEGAQP